MGFEIPDLFAIFLLLALLDLFLGDLGNQLVFVWLPSLVMALVLWFGKRGKPEGHLIHWTRFHLRPATLTAFEAASSWEPYKGRVAND